ncbi:MAG TPA: histidine ammonia-lyase [Anaerolineales bacterium]|nr:histidine ammonia-lyase [Anaerolineales bacterium]
MEKLCVLDGRSLTIEQVIGVAFDHWKVVISEDAAKMVNRAADAVQGMLDNNEIVYGVTTGFGAFKDTIISLDEVEQLQRNIILSHAVGTGDIFDIPTTRAIMLIRANTLSAGHSGIRLVTLNLLLEMLNRRIHPLIPSKGSLGASGDLAPLAHMSLPLIGVGTVLYENKILQSLEVFEKVGLKPIRLAAKEGLALTNGTSVMAAQGALAVIWAEKLSRAADVIGCLSLEAAHGTVRAFDARIHAVRPHPRQIECANYLRKILEGSEFTRGYDPTNVQDAYTLRCIPQVHGAIRDAIAYLRWVIEIELNSVTDNPLIFFDDDGKVDVISGGNFHGEPIAIAMDYLAIALAEMGNISERRTMRLTDDVSNGHVLPAFLTEHGGLNSGFMITQYTAAALATENKILAHPASVDTIPTSKNVEDHVSMGNTACLKAIEILKNLDHILAIELISAAQGIDFRKKTHGSRAKLGRGSQPVYDLVRQTVPFFEQDVWLGPEVEKVKALIHDGTIDKVLEAALNGKN